MISILPFVPSDGNYRFSTTLAEVQFTFDVRWNTRADIDPVTGKDKGAWYFDMYDADEVLMVAGIKIVLGAYLGRQSAHPWFSTNVLAAVDLTQDERDATFDDLGVRVLVQHYPAGDLLAEVTAP